MTLEAALKRYLADVTPTKKPSTQKSERYKASTLIEHLGKYSLAGLTPELIANFRDTRLELALLGHLYTVAIQEWDLGLTYNPFRTSANPALEKGATAA